MTETQHLTEADLLKWFVISPARTERIGIELETPVVHPTTGQAAAYEGTTGIRALLESILADGGTPEYDGTFLTAVTCPDGTIFSIEPGGALEYVSRPVPDLTTLVEEMKSAMTYAATLADELGLALLGAANLPFNSVDDAGWIPKPRAEVLKRYFGRLGKNGSGAPAIMTLLTSVQVTLDYLDVEDLRQKLAMQTAVSPVIAALFVNSPLHQGVPTGRLSQRIHHLLYNDPRRCGPMPFALRTDFSLGDFVEWITHLPMAYRCKDGHYIDAPDASFSELIKHGFGDGTYPSQADWISLLSQVWPTVRLRRTLEMRLPDAPPYPDVPAQIALWVGLSYDAEARTAAWELCKGSTIAEYLRALRDVASCGLRATYVGRPVSILAKELVALARHGLHRRVLKGYESPATLEYLDPIEELSARGVTYAERTLSDWSSHLANQPARYVETFRIPSIRS